MSYYIYKICCDDCPDFVYVGSTKAFRERKRNHKKNYNNMIDRKIYNTIRENGGWDNWRMVILEECGEISFTEARIKEEEHRAKLNANLNMVKCYQTEEGYKASRQKADKKYYENNKDKKQEYDKEYREKNKEKIMEWKTQKITCECGRTFRIDGKAEHERSLIHKKLIEEKNNINI
jgi:hypothetical protein